MSSLSRFPGIKEKKEQKVHADFADLGVLPSHHDCMLDNSIYEHAVQVAAPVPKSAKGVAMDSSIATPFSGFSHINQQVLQYFAASKSFIGYEAMAIIAQSDLVMTGCSSSVKDALRKGFELTRNDGQELTPEKTHKIECLDRKYQTKRNLIRAETFNNVFGIRHILYKHTDDNFDYSKPYNSDGFKGKKYAGMIQIDPRLVTPKLNDKNITDPTSVDYYNPEFWIVNGREYHRSHFTILRGDEVADILKPTYRYGGLSLTQKLYERVYSAERTANEIPQLVMSKRLNVRYVNLEKAQKNPSELMSSLEKMAHYRDNHGVLVAGTGEKVESQETTLSDLDNTMWTQYHLIAQIIGRPVSKVFGTGFGGLGTGDTDDDFDIAHLEAVRSGNLTEILMAHYGRLMASEFDEPMDLDVRWNPLKVMNEKELAEVNNLNSQTATNLNNIGAIDAMDERARLSSDKDSGYSGMELFDEVDDDDETEI